MGNLSISCCRSRSPSRLRADHQANSNCRRQSQGELYTSSGDDLHGLAAPLTSRQSRSLFNANSDRTCNKQPTSSHAAGKRNSQDHEQHPCNSLQHISEREPDDSETDPSSNPYNKPIFATRSRPAPNHHHHHHHTPPTRTKHNHRQPPQQLPLGTAATCSPATPSTPCSPVEGCPGSITARQAAYTPLACSQATDHGYNSATSANLNTTASCGGGGGGGDQSSLIIDDSINSSSNQSASIHCAKQQVVAESNQQHHQMINSAGPTESKSLSDTNKLSLLSSTTLSNELANSLLNEELEEEDEEDDDEDDEDEDEEDEEDDDDDDDEREAGYGTVSSIVTPDTSHLFSSATSGLRAEENRLSNHDRRKFSSCSTIFIDGSTISKPNLEQTMRYVSLAIYYHIKNRRSDESIAIFDETLHPLSKLPPILNNSTTTSNNIKKQSENNSIPAIEQKSSINPHVPDSPTRKAIYRFVKTLIKAAQLTAEYAITTLVYLERLMTYGEIDLTPKTWRRMFLGAILLSSKVWEDQAVWNVDYAQILDEISVDDINELERQFLELIQFNMNVPSPVYAKYYFDLRTLAATGRKTHLLTVKKARALEAMSRISSADLPSSPVHRKPEPERKRHSSLERLRENGRAAAILM